MAEAPICLASSWSDFVSGKKRKREFLKQHPICFNCGTAAATTEDHVPSRECFVGRHFPDGFVFPACEPCNAKISSIEQGMALLIRVADQDESRVDQAVMEKLIRGVRNNTPDLLPREFDTDADREKAIADSGWVPGPGETNDDAPVMALGPGWKAAVHAFARKLTLALHYRELGRPLPLDHHIRTEFFQFTDHAAPEIVEQFQAMLPEYRTGERRNFDFGDQFQYIVGRSDEEGVFAFLAQLARSWFIVGVTVPPELGAGRPEYIKHEDELKL